MSHDVIGLERQIVGTLLQNRGTGLADILEPEDFTAFPKTVRAIKRQLAEGKPVNPATLYQKDDREFTIGELAEFISEVISPALIEENVRTFRKIVAGRKAAQTLKRYSEAAAVTDEPQELITSAIYDLRQIQTGGECHAVASDDAFLSYMKDYDKRAAGKGKEMTLGMKQFDAVTAGFHTGELTTIAARPARGKTAFALQISTILAKKGYKVLFVSLEMSDKQLIERLIVRYSRVDHKKLRNAELDKDAWDSVYIALDRIAERRFYIDTHIRTVADLRAAMVDLKPDIVIIDHVGRMKDTGRFENRRVELGSISRKLKLMTLDFGTPIIMLAQLNRDAQSKRPTLAELRETGAIEEDSDNVILIHRLTIEEAMKEYGYTRESFEALIEQEKFPSLLIIEKQRNGAIKDIMTVFDPSKFAFIEAHREE